MRKFLVLVNLVGKFTSTISNKHLIKNYLLLKSMRKFIVLINLVGKLTWHILRLQDLYESVLIPRYNN